MTGLAALAISGAMPSFVEGASSVALSISADGRQHEVDITGSLSLGVSARIVLQQLTEVRGRWLWSTRGSLQVHARRAHPRFRLRWRRPPLGTPLLVRAIALAHGRLVARSSAVQVTAGDPGTVFYSGEGQAGAKDVSSKTLRLVASDGNAYISDPFDGRWTTDTKCDISAALPTQQPPSGEPITELAGYSLGRLGPIYFLDNPNSWESQISYILLLDPGSEGEMTGGGCDSWANIDPAKALASWLSLRSSNHLVIMAGPVTTGDKYTGLKHFYLKDLTPSEQRQVMICPYGRPDHTHFLVNTDGGFGWMVGAYPPTNCPGGSHEPNWRSPLPTVPPAPVSGPPTSGGGPPPLGAGEFRVMNAVGGIYWRSGRDWNTPEAAPGNGFYEGTVVKISCYQAGTANVPGSTDSMWEQASWVSGPGAGSGWINEHFIEDSAPLGSPSPGTAPCPSGSEPPPPPPPATWSEQETPNHPVNTFTNYHNASGMGPAIAAGQWVQVSCKVYDPTIASVNPDGYWYRIASSPWNNAYYSPANTFMNGDPYGGPYTHNTDFAVPDC